MKNRAQRMLEAWKQVLRKIEELAKLEVGPSSTEWLHLTPREYNKEADVLAA